MGEHLPAEHRAPPERINRTTRSGADQYVLACNARREATPITFALIERLEGRNSALRREVAWKQKHASSFTAQWLGSWVVRSLFVIVIATMFGFWLCTPNGRMARVSYGFGYNEVQGGARVERSFITSDMTQREIDSIVVILRTESARRDARE